ncbi:MAG TPA: hypothetical protein VGF67_00480 [Ktedonobacteraceae bacterium]
MASDLPDKVSPPLNAQVESSLRLPAGCKAHLFQNAASRVCWLRRVRPGAGIRPTVTTDACQTREGLRLLRF